MLEESKLNSQPKYNRVWGNFRIKQRKWKHGKIMDGGVELETVVHNNKKVYLKEKS